MKPLFTLAALLLIPFISLAEEQTELEVSNHRFTPHVGIEAYSREKGHFGFSRSPASNLNTTFLLSSLYFAINNRVELGTSLGNYLVEHHRFNMQAKYNFWRSPEVLWALSGSTTLYENKIDGLPNPIEIQLTSIELAINYLPKNLPFNFGAFYTLSIFDIKDKETKDKYFSDSSHEVGLDLSYEISKESDLTFGTGWLREQGIHALESTVWGLGFSYRYYLPDYFFSSPTLGLHYSPKNKEFSYLFSSSIY